MMISNANMVALVTGATRGIGKGIATMLADNGYIVAAVGTREAGDSYNGIYIQGDISNADDRKRIIDTVYNKYGQLNVLVNNAGVAPLERMDLLEMSVESMDRLLDINLKGTFFLTQYAASKMILDNSDSPKMIINITSISADTTSINRGEYCISKAGLSMVTKLFADRLSEHGINVYEVRPGIIETDMTAKVKDKYTALIESGLLPIKRMGQPEDVAKTVLALANGGMLYTTGEVIHVDGGFHLKRL
jgi:Dehydrogenases with different specificities (related to short-chain alcohol dehydrogenases)